MIYRENVQSDSKLPAVEHNNMDVYCRFDFASTTVDDRTVWTFNEWFMSLSEYDSLRAGRLFGTEKWTDHLRSIERSALYDNADQHIMKYSTDVSDEKKLQAWIKYKAAVRATPTAAGYPEQVVYPAAPE